MLVASGIPAVSATAAIAGQALGRIFEIFQQALCLGGDPAGGLDAPRGVGIDAQRQRGNSSRSARIASSSSSGAKTPPFNLIDWKP